MPHVTSGEDTRSAGFLRQRPPVQRPMAEIRISEEEPFRVAFNRIGEPIGVRVGADQHEQPVGRLSLFTAGC